MFYICLILIFFPCTSSALAEEPRIESFNIFGAINNIVGGLSNFSTLIQSLKDVFSILFSESVTNTQTNSSISVPEDTFLNISELTKKYGYNLEEYSVTTEDGYILKLHRIPHGKNGPKNNLTIFLMHGIIDSSDSWILQGPDAALAYILADEGFDVWMGNARGNKHALSHATLNPTQSEFWTFTWEEIGRYDLPAMIDFVLNVTEMESLYYVGHSQGTTSFYVMNSLKPEYNSKIKMMFSLAPVAWMRHVKSPIVKMFSPAYKILEYFLSNFNTYSPTTEFFNKIASVVCTLIPNQCDNMLYMIIGSNYKYINESMLPVILGHIPSGSSTLQFIHYGQLVQSGRFCRYDFGVEKIFDIYGLSSPPDYDLSLISIPVVLYYSGNDWLSDPNDVGMLKDQLKVYDELYIEDFSHIDYMYASIAKDIVYSRIIEQIRGWEGRQVGK